MNRLSSLEIEQINGGWLHLVVGFVTGWGAYEVGVDIHERTQNAIRESNIESGSQLDGVVSPGGRLA